MSISNVGTLRTAVETWLGGRSLAGQTSLFLEWTTEITNILHTGMRDDADEFWVVPPLRSRLMEATDSLTVTSATAALPTDWLESRRLWVNTNSGRPLRYLPLSEFWQDWRSRATGEPEVYTVDGTNLLFGPISDATVEISFYQTLGDLSADASTNVILTGAPHVYRRGCLWMALDWEGPDEGGPNIRAGNELRGFASVVKALNAQTKDAQHSGSLLVQRTVRAPV